MLPQDSTSTTGDVLLHADRAAELERIIRDNLQAADLLYVALAEFHAGEGWRALGHVSFVAWAADQFPERHPRTLYRWLTKGAALRNALPAKDTKVLASDATIPDATTPAPPARPRAPGRPLGSRDKGQRQVATAGPKQEPCPHCGQMYTPASAPSAQPANAGHKFRCEACGKGSYWNVPRCSGCRGYNTLKPI